MRIEILVDNEDPRIFALTKPQTLIGSHVSCDIVLQTGGVSRKHIIVAKEGDKYFVIDQGSTNGSYINEERLVPGRQVEFSSFFPLRLGSAVLVTLLSDEDASDLGFPAINSNESHLKNYSDEDDSSTLTRTISLKDLQAAGRTEALVKKRQENVVKRKLEKKPLPTPKAKDKSRMFLVKVFSILLLGAAAYYNILVKTPEKTITTKVTTPLVLPTITPIAVAPKFNLVDERDLVPKSRLDEIQKGLSCEGLAEKLLCEKFGAGIKAIQIGTMIYVFYPGDEYLQKARELVKKPASGELAHNDLLLATMILFLEARLPKDFDFATLNDLNVTFALPVDVSGVGRDYSSMAITSQSLSKLAQVIKPKYIGYLERYGIESVNFMKEYFRMDYNRL